MRYAYEEDTGYDYYIDSASKVTIYQEDFATSDFSFDYSGREDLFAVLRIPDNCFVNVYVKDAKDTDRVYYKYWSNDKEQYCDIVDCGDGWYEIKPEKSDWIFNNGIVEFYNCGEK